MFAVIYIFEVKPGMDKQFKESQKERTKYIYKYEGSKGSRLHKRKDLEYIAYAHWPSKKGGKTQVKIYQKRPMNIGEKCVMLATRLLRNMNWK